jgi:hypothetical protein
MFDNLLLLALGSWCVGYAIGNFVSRKAFQAMPLGLAIAYRVAAAFISAVAAALAGGSALFISVIVTVLFKHQFGLSDDVMIYGTFTFVALAALLIALVATRIYYTTALHGRKGP